MKPGGSGRRPNPSDLLPLLVDAGPSDPGAYSNNHPPEPADVGNRDVSSTDRLHHVWSQALDQLRGGLPRPSFEIWVRPLQPVALSDGTVVLGTPSDSAKLTLEDQYVPQISKALESVLGQKVTVRFVTLEVPAAELAPLPARAMEPEGPDHARHNMNPRYTFDIFVVGSSNRLAHAASLAVAEMPGRAYNPLFIYGGVGLGKTHLMQAIGHQALVRRPALKVLYVPAETFTNEMVNAVRDGKGYEFRNRYRTIDLLLIDDIQFIAGKVGTQEEFFHTFEALYGAQKQIVISSDRPPKEITTLEHRLRSRFEWGLITDIQPPDYETRLAILRKRCLVENLSVDDEALEYIANHIESNIRELEGAFIRYIAHCSVHHLPFTAEHAPTALRELLPTPRERKITIRAIQETVADYYNLQLSDFSAKRRTRSISYPRQIAMYLARELTESSLPLIGEEFGGRDHTTVIHACKQISQALLADSQLRQVMSDLRVRILG